MTLPSGGNNPPISLSDLNTEFGLGTNLSAYRGKIYGKTDGTVGVFSSGAINVSDFYATAKVVGGSDTLTSTSLTSYKIKPYKTIRITVTAAGGGGAGGRGSGDGFCDPGNGGNGTDAVASSFGVSGAAWYLSCAGGGKGFGNGTAGTTQTGNAGNGANGGAAGTNYGGSLSAGAGGAGAKSVVGYLTNPALSGGTGPASAATIALAIGAAGTQGGGSPGVQYSPVFAACVGNNNNGNSGSAGGAASILIEWTGEA